MRKPAYITIEGRPLCQCEFHVGGLINRLGVSCGYRSIADAKRAKLEIQKHRHSVRVVPGICPGDKADGIGLVKVEEDR